MAARKISPRLDSTGDPSIDNLLAWSCTATGDRRAVIAAQLTAHFAELVKRAQAGDAAVAMMRECAGGPELLDTLAHAKDAELEALAEQRNARREGWARGERFRHAELYVDAIMQIAKIASAGRRALGDIGSENVRHHESALETIVDAVRECAKYEAVALAETERADEAVAEAENENDTREWARALADLTLRIIGPWSPDESLDVHNARLLAEGLGYAV